MQTHTGSEPIDSIKYKQYSKFDEIVDNVVEEYERASSLFPPFNSAHEGFAVLLEEVDELKAEVWKSPKNRNHAAMIEEAKQVAAMALRFLMDC